VKCHVILLFGLIAKWIPKINTNILVYTYINLCVIFYLIGPNGCKTDKYKNDTSGDKLFCLYNFEYESILDNNGINIFRYLILYNKLNIIMQKERRKFTKHKI